MKVHYCGVECVFPALCAYDDCRLIKDPRVTDEKTFYETRAEINREAWAKLLTEYAK